MLSIYSKNGRELYQLRLNRNSIQGHGGDAVYKGQLNEIGVPEGVGRLVKRVDDGVTKVYVGEFKKGKRSGRGTQTTHRLCNKQDGEEGKCVYEVCEGEWKKDRPHGRVTMYYADGSVYVGEMRKGQRFGRGRLSEKDDCVVWEGEWRYNRRWGQGVQLTKHPQGGVTVEKGTWFDEESSTLLSSSNSLFLRSDIDYRMIISHYKDDQRVAVGKLIFHNGDTYEGELVDYVAQGVGRYNNSFGGSYYVGDFANNWACGQGKRFDERDRLVYSGEFRGNTFHGKGTLFEETSYYQGDFVMGKKHGKGILETNDGSKYKGEFQYDKYHGLGKLIQYNQFIYRGGFYAGEFHGLGVLNFVDERVLRGTFVHGQHQNFKTGKLSKIKLKIKASIESLFRIIL